jgi:sigma-B regulation protein RsbU (phosphoserine phosphatase)
MTKKKERVFSKMLFFRSLALVAMTIITTSLAVSSFWMRHEGIAFLKMRPGFSVDTTEVVFGSWEDVGLIRQQGFVRVSRVGTRSAAQKAGFEIGDSIIAVNGKQLKQTPQAFGRAFLGAYPGKRIEFQIARNGRREHRILVLEDNSFFSYSPWEYLNIEGTWLTKVRADSIGADTTQGFLITMAKSKPIGANAWVQSGDIIVRFNGVPLESESQFFRLMQESAQSQVSIEYLRSDKIHSTSAHSNNPLFDFKLIRYLTLLPPFLLLLFLLVGATIGWARLRDPNAFQFSLWIQCWIVFLCFFVIPMQISWPNWALCALACAFMSSLCLFVLLTINLFAVFPNPTRLGKIVLRSKWFVFAVCCLSAFIYTGKEMLNLFGGNLSRFSNAIPSFVTDIQGYVLAAVLALGPALLIAQRIETRHHPERRLKIIEYALMSVPMGIIISIVIGLISWGLSTQAIGGILTPILILIALLVALVSFFALPLLLAYGLLTHKVFGIRFFLRKGLQYLLVSKGALLLEGGAIFLIIWKIIGTSGSRLAQSVPAMSGVALGSAALIIVGLSRVNRGIMPVIDRRFFREAYDVRRLLSGLSEQLSNLRERDKILRRTAATVLKTLHPHRVVILSRGGEVAHLKGALSIENGHSRQISYEQLEQSAILTPPFELEAEDSIIKQLEQGKAWADVYPERLDSTIEEEERLFELNCELLVALRGSAGLIGVMALGGKLSEEPFSREDKELLLTVARQMGMALENAELLEVAKREAQQARELEVAREVQQNLFPKELPQAEGWEFAAICRPARATGGDYYDMFAINAEHVAFALGDVSGKGLGPSLVMASVQSMVRSGLRRKGTELPNLMGELNDHLLESTSPEMFITLFIGVLNVKTGHMRFVNGGHPPPVLVAKQGVALIRLEQRGIMVGILPGFQYSEGEANMEASSSLVLFSDGVTEAAATMEEMFGEERLLEVLNKAGAGAASAILDSVLEAVDCFTGQAEQSDDISLIVIRRLR